jgi:N6-L-threonylcarbamoyladenine synthase
MKILAIETSCDETAAAIVTADKEILSHVIFSQIKEHQLYGGVVPEIAARAHLDKIEQIISRAIADANLSLNEIDAVAVTAGPGLIGGVIVGVMVAKGIASVTGKPFIAVNHLEGHALTIRLVSQVEFPFLLLLLSGGHCQILAVEAVGKYKKLGGTIDDALGEAFDKVAKMLGLDYPGGPLVEKLALAGDPRRFAFPQPLKGKIGCDFSFSGLKTAVRREVEKLGSPTTQDIADICASFQYTVTEVLKDRLQNAIQIYQQDYLGTSVVLAGGVAANQYINQELKNLAARYGMELVSPPPALCTDNAAMIGWAGIERLRLGLIDTLDFEPRASWPLDTNLQSK